MELSDFNQWLAEKNMVGFWARKHRVVEVKPYLWKWADLNQALETASDLVPMDKTGRRNVGLRNPTVKGGLTNTITLGLQIIKPGEFAQCHRHVATAIRFVVKGSPKAFTVVEGERLFMEEGDLITTPNWTWHDHYNGSDEPVIWLDGLDVRLLGHLNAQFSEPLPQEQQVIEKPDGYSATMLGYARPSWLKNQYLVPPYRYVWKEIYATDKLFFQIAQGSSLSDILPTLLPVETKSLYRGAIIDREKDSILLGRILMGMPLPRWDG